MRVLLQNYFFLSCEKTADTKIFVCNPDGSKWDTICWQFPGRKILRFEKLTCSSIVSMTTLHHGNHLHKLVSEITSVKLVIIIFKHQNKITFMRAVFCSVFLRILFGLRRATNFAVVDTPFRVCFFLSTVFSLPVHERSRFVSCIAVALVATGVSSR